MTLYLDQILFSIDWDTAQMVVFGVIFTKAKQAEKLHKRQKRMEFRRGAKGANPVETPSLRRPPDRHVATRIPASPTLPLSQSHPPKCALVVLPTPNKLQKDRRGGGGDPGAPFPFQGRAPRLPPYFTGLYFFFGRQCTSPRAVSLSLHIGCLQSW